MRALTATLMSLAMSLAGAQRVVAWGDEGHKTVAQIAQQCLRPVVRQKITAMLAADTDNLAPHDFASAATWADKYRDSNSRKDHYVQTRDWHFVDIEIDDPDLNSACFGHPPLPTGELASTLNQPKVCVVDKIKEFEAELSAPSTDAEERLVALKFLLHFVGDIHQPLHSSDHHDNGGNSVKVKVVGFPRQGALHHFWDTEFVLALGEPPALADQLRAQITPADATRWAAGKPEDWAMEAFKIAQADVYGDPPLSTDKLNNLSAAYASAAEKDVSLQLRRAGVRLADLLNRSLGGEPTDWNGCLKSASVSSHVTTSTKIRKKRRRGRH